MSMRAYSQLLRFRVRQRKRTAGSIAKSIFHGLFTKFASDFDRLLRL